MGGHLSRWMLACSAHRGRAHEAAGGPCQDYAAGRSANGVTAVALADGAGSASCSDVGARVAVESVLELLTHRFPSLVEEEPSSVRAGIAAELHERLAAEAARCGVPLRELASTLLFVAVSSDAFLAGHLGDGVIAIERRGELSVLSHPERGEFLNETVFTTSPRAAEHLRLERGCLDEETAFLLMSDGSADSLYARREQALARGARSIASWLDARSPADVEGAIARALRDVIGTKTSDDCSLAILREVTISASALRERDLAFQKSFLGCKTRRGVGSRLAVATAVTEQAGSARDIAMRAGVSPNTARAHLRALHALVRVAVQPGDTGARSRTLITLVGAAPRIESDEGSSRSESGSATTGEDAARPPVNRASHSSRAPSCSCAGLDP